MADSPTPKIRKEGKKEKREERKRKSKPATLSWNRGGSWGDFRYSSRLSFKNGGSTVVP